MLNSSFTGNTGNRQGIANGSRGRLTILFTWTQCGIVLLRYLLATFPVLAGAARKTHGVTLDSVLWPETGEWMSGLKYSGSPSGYGCPESDAKV